MIMCECVRKGGEEALGHEHGTESLVCGGVVVVVGVDAIAPRIAPLVLHHQLLKHRSGVTAAVRLQVDRLLVDQQRQLLVVGKSLAVIFNTSFPC
jgi:hypothetical protein